MFEVIITMHSFLKWFVLFFLIITLITTFCSLRQKAFQKDFFDSLVYRTTALLHIQFVVGVILYMQSPTPEILFGEFKEMLKEREIRFFGLEHPVSMFIAITIATITSHLKTKNFNIEKQHKIIFWGFLITLIVIIAAIPWSFSPIVSREELRI